MKRGFRIKDKIGRLDAEKVLFYFAFLLFLFSSFLILYARYEQRDGLTVSFFDVGQGDAVFIDNINGVQVLIDGGKDKKVLYGLSEAMPFYDRSIDVVIATHPDSDHIGGLIDVLRRYRVGLLVEPKRESQDPAYLAMEKVIEQRGIKKIYAVEGMAIDLGKGALLKILAPCRGMKIASDNAASIVAKLSYGKRAFLFTADATKGEKKCIIKNEGGLLKSDVLKIAHHGSKYSFLESFVNLVSPRYAVISAGRNNRYHHPHKSVLDYLKARQIKILGTYKSGTIKFFTNGNNLEIK